MEVINLNEKLGKFADHFNPRIIAELTVSMLNSNLLFKSCFIYTEAYF